MLSVDVLMLLCVECNTNLLLFLTFYGMHAQEFYRLDSSRCYRMVVSDTE